MRCVTQGDPPLIAHRGQLHHEVFGLNEFHRDVRIDAFFPQASTQIDSLRHFVHPDHGFYNGTPGQHISTWTEDLGIHHVAEAVSPARGYCSTWTITALSAAGPSTIRTTSRSLSTNRRRPPAAGCCFHGRRHPAHSLRLGHACRPLRRGLPRKMLRSRTQRSDRGMAVGSPVQPGRRR